MSVDLKEWYRNGWYSMPVPPVHTWAWTEQNWINHISAHGRWHKPKGETS